jgi:AraC family transcriptional regulator of arabinose operon
VLWPVELDPAGNPGTSQPHERRLDHVLAVDCLVTVGQVSNGMNPAPDLGKQHDLHKPVVKKYRVPFTLGRLLGDSVVERQRIDAAAAPLVNALFQKHGIEIRRVWLVSGKRDRFSADADGFIHRLSLFVRLCGEQGQGQSKTYTILLLIKDRIAFDLPAYEGLLAGHYIRGQGYGRKRPGGTDDWLLIMTLEGKGRIGTDKGDLFALPNTLFLIGPGATHDYGTAKDADVWEILWVHFHPPTSWMEMLRWPAAATNVFFLSSDKPTEIDNQFREVLQQSMVSGPLRSAFAMNALERLLLLCQTAQSPQSELLDERVKIAIDYMHGHLGEQVSLDGLSRLVHLSPSRFSHLFRQSTGLPPGQFLTIQRLQRAQTLLKRTTLGVAEIAAEVGMDPFYFSLRLKKETGKSPREYRRS